MPEPLRRRFVHSEELRAQPSSGGMYEAVAYYDEAIAHEREAVEKAKAEERTWLIALLRDMIEVGKSNPPVAVDARWLIDRIRSRAPAQGKGVPFSTDLRDCTCEPRWRYKDCPVHGKPPEPAPVEIKPIPRDYPVGTAYHDTVVAKINEIVAWIRRQG